MLATPNYNAEADGMASIIAHETMEVSTDPLINAWCADLAKRWDPSSKRSQIPKGILMPCCVHSFSTVWYV